MYAHMYTAEAVRTNNSSFPLATMIIKNKIEYYSLNYATTYYTTNVQFNISCYLRPILNF